MHRACEFCGNPASLGPTPELPVCRSCAKLIGALALTDTTSAAMIWSRQARPPHVMPASPGEADVERVFQEFKAGVAKQVTQEDYETHFDLAEAYREMGLLQDALREAGVTLTAAAPKMTPLATKLTNLALRFVLSPPLLKPRGLEHLRSLLRSVN